MTDAADAAELAWLDAVIAEGDADDGWEDRWLAVDAVHRKARLIERLEGDDAALPLYEEAVARLTGCREPGPRALLIIALNDIVIVHHQQGREAQSRSVAETVVSDHFDDPPREATEDVVNATLMLAKMLCGAQECERALALLERFIARYGQPGVPDHAFTAATANADAAWVLGEMGRVDEGIRRCREVIRDLGDPVDLDLRKALSDALVKLADLYTDQDLPARRNAVCEEIVERFADSDAPQIVKAVTWAQMILDEYPVPPSRRGLRRRLADTALPPAAAPDGCTTPEDWFALGYRLHHGVGRAGDAEAAYVQAIEGGRADAWLNLGILLSAFPQRLTEEESALGTAMGSDDPDTAAWAALRLGNIRDWLHGDLEGARRCFELAAERGRGVTARHAMTNLAFLAAYQGDRAAAREAFSAAATAIGDERDVDMKDSAQRIAAYIAAEAATPPTRWLWRLYRGLRYRARRRYGALRVSSLPARGFARLMMRIRRTNRAGTAA